MKKYSSSITGAVILLSLTSILARGIGFFREVLFANSFGLNKDFEVYLVAAVLPVLINTAVYYLAQNYFIPLYNKLNSADSRKQFLSQQFWLFVLLGTGLTVLALLFKKIILESYIGESSNNIFGLASEIFTIYVLSFPINAGFSILTAYLQAELNFRHPALAQLLLNLPIIALVLFFHDALMVLAIPYGYLAGNILQLAYLIIIIGPGLLRLSLRGGEWKVKNVFSGSLFLIIAIEIINQLHPFIDRYFYDKVQQGGIAALSYASVIYGLPVTIFSFALASVIFPLLSKYYNSDTPEKSEEYYFNSLKLLTAVFIPIALVYIFNGEFIISLIYQRGEFTIQDTKITSLVLRMYSISLVFYAAYAIINKMIFSSGLLKQLLILSIVLVIVKILLNSYWVSEFEQDGLAISSSITYILLSAGGYFLVSGKLTKGKKYIFPKYLFIYSLLGLAIYYISNQVTVVLRAAGLTQLIVFAAIYILSIWFIDLPRFSLKQKKG